MQIDAYDKKILMLLQQDSRISQRVLAEKVNLSASAINRRIAALEAAGIIKGYNCIIDTSKIARQITIIVEVRIESERRDLFEEAKKKFAACPQIQQIYYVTGDFDFLLVLNVADMAEYERLTQELFFSSNNIRSFKTYVSMDNVKQSLNVQIT